MKQFSFGNIKLMVVGLLTCMIFSFGASIAIAQDLQSGLDTAAEITYGSSKTSTDISTVVGAAILRILQLIGVIFFALLTYGGVSWMLSRGNESEVTKAKTLIIAAVVGLLIVLSSYIITTTVFDAARTINNVQ